MIPINLSSSITTKEPTSSSAIFVRASNTVASGPMDQMLWPFCPRIFFMVMVCLLAASWYALRRATTHAATSMASRRAPLEFRRLDNNPSILAYRGRVQGLVDSAYGSDRRSTLAADRGRFGVQSRKPQLGRDPAPPFGVPRDYLHSDRGSPERGNRKGICRYPSLCAQLPVRHMIASEPEYCFGFDPTSI